MANPEHVEILKQGVEAWNSWRKEKCNVTPDLKGISLNEVNLHLANLSGVDLRGAKIRDSYFRWVDLRGANCGQAQFTNSNLTGTHLRWCSFNGAEFFESNLKDSKVGFTVFSDVDLSNAMDLEWVQHFGPSSIGIDTICKSRGQIPDAFLRGCGLSDVDIEYSKLHKPNISNREVEEITYNIAQLRMQGPIQFHSCFISHSTKDADFAEQLHNGLQDSRVRCWYAPEDMKGGKKIYPQIDEAIKIHDKLILILSESSISSPWVATEIKRTLKHERQDKRQRLFPISLIPYDALRDWELFDADSGTDLAAEVRSYYIPDFSNWKDRDCYKKAFDRLLKDLKAGE